MRFLFIAAALLLLVQARAQAGVLQLERVDLGEEALGEQSYNLQEQGDLRMFARSEAGFKRSRLYLQKRIDAAHWASPEALPFSDARWRDSDPHLSADARTLTFVSNRPPSGETPLPQLDLYESRWVDGRWSVPQRLPEAWQSPAYELGPERYGEQLFLASARTGGARQAVDLPGRGPRRAAAAAAGAGQSGAAQQRFQPQPRRPLRALVE